MHKNYNLKALYAVLMLLLQFWKLDPKFVSMMSCMTENFVICAKDNPFITYKIKTKVI